MKRNAFALLLWLGTVPAAHAGAELGLGVTDEISGATTRAFTLSYVGEQRNPWEGLIGHLDERDANAEVPSPRTTILALSKRLVWRDWFISSGIALVDADNDILSGPAQFITGLGWRGEHFTMTVRHISNAGTQGHNRGETFFIVAYAW